jgi:uncharacterized membrane protein YccC
MAATLVSFVLCLIYLIYLAFLPFHAWALAVLVGASALAVMLLGRPGDAVTAGITTAVIMVVAAVSPQHAWQQPILRLADTVVGVAVGALAAWIGIRVRRFPSARSVPPDPAEVKVDLPERAVERAPTLDKAGEAVAVTVVDAAVHIDVLCVLVIGLPQIADDELSLGGHLGRQRQC